MRLKFTDWEIEKEFLEDFYDYDYRYYLDEIINKEGLIHQSINILATNDFSKVLLAIGKIALTLPKGQKIEFIENKSILEFYESLKI